MKSLVLPPLSDGRQAPTLPSASQLTIIGAAGAGKSKFMEALVKLTGDRAYCLSAVSAMFPEREESTQPGSIDMQFREAIANKPYMKGDAVSELDKLTYMLFTDEFEHLLSIKDKCRDKGSEFKDSPTRLDKLADLWEKIFPGNRIMRSKGTMMFTTSAGNEPIGADRLSQGEKTVLYYAAAVLYARRNAVVFVDSPSLFLHPTVLNNLWNSIEELRPDCRFIYNSVDVEFVSSRTQNVSVWVKSYDAATNSWDYEILKPGELHEDIFVDLVGSRRPILFIEGDASHSIDSRLYPLVFPEWTVKPLGSCNKVIETTRTFNDQKNLHHLESRGIVDRDRRTKAEVDYLRRKSIMVPDVAEIENLFLLEGVIRCMALRRGKNPESVFSKVRKNILAEFGRRYQEQALQHVRHRVKREMEYKVDMRFSCITAMEAHLKSLFKKIDPRSQYNRLLSEFRDMINNRDYSGVLRVFNHKPMLGESGVANELGYRHRDDYVSDVISVLKEKSDDAILLRECIRNAFHLSDI